MSSLSGLLGFQGQPTLSPLSSNDDGDDDGNCTDAMNTCLGTIHLFNTHYSPMEIVDPSLQMRKLRQRVVK